MSLVYSYIEDEHKNMPLPPTRPNGGLYTGMEATGSWGAYPVVPDGVVYTTQNLKSAQPPPLAMNHPYTFVRPGNNPQMPYPSISQLSGYNFSVVEPS